MNYKNKNCILHFLCVLCAQFSLCSLWLLYFLRMPFGLNKHFCSALLFYPILTFSQPAYQQPKQILSKVKYDTNIKDTFFEKKYFSFEWFMIDNEDGTFSSAIADSLGNPIIDTTKSIHTANCVTQHQGEHTIRYCTAFNKGDTLLLFVNDFTASTYDNLLIKVINGKFSCQYWTAYPNLHRSEKLTWTTTSQLLTLNAGTYKTGDEVKGKIYVMIKEEQLTHEGKKETTKIMIEGAVKTKVVEGK